MEFCAAGAFAGLRELFEYHAELNVGGVATAIACIIFTE